MAAVKYKRFVVPEGFPKRSRLVGVYAIVNLVNGKGYIGSSVDVVGRWRLHRSLLLDGKHWTVHLQLAWNKYGADAFSLVLLDECDPTILRAQEEAWITITDACSREYGYNGSPTTAFATATPEGQESRRQWARSYWAKWREEGRTASDQKRERVRQAVTEAWADGTYAARKTPTRTPHSEATKAKQRETRLRNLAAQTPEEKAKAAETSRANGRRFTGETADHEQRAVSQQARRARERDGSGS